MIRAVRPWFPLLAGSVFYAFALVWAAGELPEERVPLHFDPTGETQRCSYFVLLLIALWTLPRPNPRLAPL